MSQSVEFHILMYGKRKQLEGMTLFIILNLPLYNFACWKQIQNVHILRTNNLNEFNYYAVNIINKMANMRGRERCSLRSRSVRSVLRRPNLHVWSWSVFAMQFCWMLYFNTVWLDLWTAWFYYKSRLSSLNELQSWVFF